MILHFDLLRLQAPIGLSVTGLRRLEGHRSLIILHLAPGGLVFFGRIALVDRLEQQPVAGASLVARRFVLRDLELLLKVVGSVEFIFVLVLVMVLGVEA